MYIMANKLRFLDDENFISSTLFFGKWVKAKKSSRSVQICPYQWYNCYKKEECTPPVEKKNNCDNLKEKCISNRKYEICLSDLKNH